MLTRGPCPATVIPSEARDLLLGGKNRRKKKQIPRPKEARNDKQGESRGYFLAGEVALAAAVLAGGAAAVRPYLRWKRSTRPAVSTNLILPVK